MTGLHPGEVAMVTKGTEDDVGLKQRASTYVYVYPCVSMSIQE